MSSALPDVSSHRDPPLRLLLCVDHRPALGEKVRQIVAHLEHLQGTFSFSFETIDVVDQPYVAEHFRLVATPSLVKLHPPPRQTLTGTNLLEQIDRWWERWWQAAEEFAERQAVQGGPAVDIGGGYSAEIIRLSDEVFQLERQCERLESLLKFRDRAIETLAHDLRSPLAAASVALETLEAGMEPKSIQAAHLTEALRARLLGQARNQIRIIDRMVGNLLMSTQQESTVAVPIDPQSLDLGQVATNAIESLRSRIDQKHLTLEIDIPQDLPAVYADRDSIRQVIVNLLDNAVKYTPEGGQISLSTLHRTTQKVQVSICDSGPGIPADKRQQIFKTRFRLQRDAGREGFGIGLAVCQEAIRAHYGQIWVDSEPGQGSCFHFTLPVYR